MDGANTGDLQGDGRVREIARPPPAALYRAESRATSYRQDVPTRDAARRLRTVLLQRGDSGAIRITAPIPAPASPR